MTRKFKQGYVRHAGDDLKTLVRRGSCYALLASLLATAFIWAGTDTFNCSALIWKLPFAFSLCALALMWLLHLPFRHTDRAVGHGVVTALLLFVVGSTCGFGFFYFYFLFAPMSPAFAAAGSWLPVTAVAVVTAMMLHRAGTTVSDIRATFEQHKNLFGRVYCDEGERILVTEKTLDLLRKARPDRNPPKSFHVYLYVALAVSPLRYVLNRLTTPFLGDGHGVFLLLAFLSVPFLVLGTETIVTTILTLIYYPIKLQHQTGKAVILQAWSYATCQITTLP